MTAEEIRKEKFEHDDGAWESARWLQEIAAQLAELNAKMPRFDSVKFTSTEQKVSGSGDTRSLFEQIFGKSDFGSIMR
jgi:hypothetical protein